MQFSESNALVASARLPDGKASQSALWAKATKTGTFYQQHLWLPLTAFAALSVMLMGLGADQWLADRIYVAGGHAWTLQSNPLVEGIIHEGGRQASKWAWIAVAVCLLLALASRTFASWRMPLTYLLLSTLLATLLVAVLKRGTHMDCPWDLLRYGGEKVYYGLFSRRLAGMGSADCFPAGHASAGYAWVALYFFFLATRPRWRWWGLGAAMVLGMVFGIAQQLRGAHFLSHDLWTLMLCWLVALSLHRVMLVPRMRDVCKEAVA